MADYYSSKVRLNKLIKLIKERLGMSESEAIDFICNAAHEKQYSMPRVEKKDGNSKP